MLRKEGLPFRPSDRCGMCTIRSPILDQQYAQLSHPWGYTRVFAHPIVVAHSVIQMLITVHILNMPGTVKCIPEINTGGERRC